MAPKGSKRELAVGDGDLLAVSPSKPKRLRKSQRKGDDEQGDADQTSPLSKASNESVSSDSTIESIVNDKRAESNGGNSTVDNDVGIFTKGFDSPEYVNDIREGGLTAKTDNDMELNADETDSGSAKPNVDALFGTRSGSPTSDAAGIFDTPPGSPSQQGAELKDDQDSTLIALKKLDDTLSKRTCLPSPASCEMKKVIVETSGDPIYRKEPYIAKPFRDLFRGNSLPKLRGAGFVYFNGMPANMSGCRITSTAFSKERQGYYSLLSNFVSYENVGNPARDDPTRYQIIAENNAVPGKMFVAKIGSSTPAIFLSLVLTSRPTNLIEGVKTKSGDYVVRQLFATFQSGDVERIQGFCGMLVGSEAVRCNCIDRGDVKFSGSPDKIGHASSNVRSPSKNFWGRGQNVSSTSAQLVVRDVPVFNGQSMLELPNDLVNLSKKLPSYRQEMETDKPVLVAYVIKVDERGLMDFTVNWAIALEPKSN